MKRLDISSPFDAPVLYTPETSSTMDEAKRYVNEHSGKAAHGTAVVTDYQSKGRGRVQHRNWRSAPGDSILTTLILHLPEKYPVSSVSIRLALAVSLYLEGCYGLEPSIKWPNDVLAEGRKISGILCEVSSRYIYGGIGINCRQGSFEVPSAEEDSSFEGTSIYVETGKEPSVPEDLPRLYSIIAEVLEYEGLDKAEERLYRRGEVLTMLEGHPAKGREVNGRVEGLAKDGALIMRRSDNGELQHLYSGEATSQYI